MATMTANIREGYPRDSELLEKVDSKRDVGDSRSPRLRKLLWMGVTAEDALEDAGIEFDDAEDREEFIREAIRSYVDDECRTVSP